MDRLRFNIPSIWLLQKREQPTRSLRRPRLASSPAPRVGTAGTTRRSDNSSSATLLFPLLSSVSVSTSVSVSGEHVASTVLARPRRLWAWLARVSERGLKPLVALAKLLQAYLHRAVAPAASSRAIALPASTCHREDAAFRHLVFGVAFKSDFLSFVSVEQVASTVLARPRRLAGVVGARHRKRLQAYLHGTSAHRRFPR